MTLWRDYRFRKRGEGIGGGLRGRRGRLLGQLGLFEPSGQEFKVRSVSDCFSPAMLGCSGAGAELERENFPKGGIYQMTMKKIWFLFDRGQSCPVLTQQADQKQPCG